MIGLADEKQIKHNKISNAQRRAADKWDAKHPDNARHRVAKSTTKRFITQMASESELAEVKAWLSEREQCE